MDKECSEKVWVGRLRKWGREYPVEEGRIRCCNYGYELQAGIFEGVGRCKAAVHQLIPGLELFGIGFFFLFFFLFAYLNKQVDMDIISLSFHGLPGDET